MATKLKFETLGNEVVYTAQPPTLVLMTRSGVKLGLLPATDEVVHFSMNAADEISFSVTRTLEEREADTETMISDRGSAVAGKALVGISVVGSDSEKNISKEVWDNLVDFKLLWCKEWNKVFEIYVEVDENDHLTKYITGTALGEAELGQIMLHDIQINTEDDIARDDYVVTVLYNENNPSGSLLNRIMDKASHYTIAHVDNSIKNIQRTFTFDGTSIYDAFQDISEEIGCIFIIDCYLNSDLELVRSVSVYDLYSVCGNCGERGDFIDVCPECGSTNITSGYGDDTTIFVSVDNLTDDIKYSTDTGSVKNCFKLESGDELMDAAIIATNPNGSSYLWYISDEMKADMSSALVSKLDDYNKQYDYYQTAYEFVPSGGVIDYNYVIAKYMDYSSDYPLLDGVMVGYPSINEAYYNTVDFYFYLNNSLMPTPSMSGTTASAEAAKLTVANLSPVAVSSLQSISSDTAQNAVLGMAQVIVDNRYKITPTTSSFSNNVWTGYFTVTNYSDEDDTATSSSVSITISDDYESYVKQKTEKALNRKMTDDATDIVTLFDMSLTNFSNEIKKYSLSALQGFADNAQSCIDILIEQGIADKDTWASAEDDLYTNMYLPYLAKKEAIEAEIATRTNEIKIVSDMQDKLLAAISSIQSALNMQTFFGSSLWKEFIAYRREDTYQNSNYISDGLTNAELLESAAEFIESAKKEIYKSATLQHSISSTLKNLLVIKEFQPLAEHFECGNWLRIKIDNKVYRLRLLDYEIEYDNLGELNVTFSDVTKTSTGLDDVSSILKSATSMATSYNAVAHQAKTGSNKTKLLDNWVENGLGLTTMKIVNDADQQNVTYDEHGILAREYDPILGDYDDRQLKIINKGIYVTNDGWESAVAGLGEFTYYDPETHQNVVDYGVIARTIIGKLILGEKLAIYSEDGNTVINEDGITITTDLTASSDARKYFKIQIKDQDSGGTYIEPVFYVDSNGALQLGSDGRKVYLNEKEIATADVAVASVVNEYNKNTSSNTPPSSSDSGWRESQYQTTTGEYLWQRVKTVYADSTTQSPHIEYSDPLCLTATSGSNGISTAVVFLYQRASSSSSPSAPSGSLTYTFSTGVLSGTLGNWSQSVPASNGNPCWMIQATASTSATASTDTIPSGEWSSPVIFVEDGSGTDGYNQATIFLYQRAASAPSKPSSSLTYTFSTGVLSGTLGNWSKSIPTANGNPCYITTAAAVSRTNTDTIASNEWSDVVKLVEDGTKGDTGVGVSAVTNYYLASASSSGVTTSTSGWTTSIQNPTSSLPYLWNYEKVTYTNSNSVNTTPCIIGNYAADGSPGRGISSIVEYYARSSSNSTEPSSGWDTNVPTLTSTYKYLWNYEVINYTDNSTPYTSAKRVIGVYGDKGEKGDTGDKAQYGTCSTSASTQEKAVTCSDFVLKSGAELTIKFSTANTYTSGAVKLNVNSTGAKNVWVDNAVTSSTNQLLWGANAYISFKYDGTQFIVLGEPKTWYGGCSTAAATAEKTDTTAITGCVICKGTKVELAMTYENTNTAPTLNIQSTGAKTLYIGSGTTRPYTSNGFGWVAGATIAFTFDGSVWRMGGKTYISGDHIITGTIDANDVTVINLNASNISTGTLSADRIAASSITAGKLSVTDFYTVGATIGGWQIDSTSIHTNNVAVTSNADNSVALSSSTFTRTIGGTSRSNLKFAIGSGFGVANTGTLYASGAVISGDITATSLSLGTNASIAATKVTGLASVATSGSASDISGLASVATGGDLAAGKVTGLATVATSGDADDLSGLADVATSGSYDDLSDKPNLTVYIRKDGTIGTVADGSTGFTVSSAGLLQASNAVVYGTIYASAGKIGGFALESNSIHTNNVAVTSNAENSVALSSSTFARTIGGTSRSNLKFAIGSNLGVSSTGVLYANDVNLTGKITATSGKVGSLYINALPAPAGGILSLDGYLSTGTFTICETTNESYVTKESVSHSDCGTTLYGQSISVWAGSYDTISMGASSNNYGYMYLYNSSGTSTIHLGGSSGTITAVTVNATNWGSGSDERMKNSIAPLNQEDSAEFIYGLRPVSFRYNEYGDDIHHGFIAQDVETLIKDKDWNVVSYMAKDDTDYENNNYVDETSYKTLSYIEIIADLVATVQSLNDRVCELEQSINT